MAPIYGLTIHNPWAWTIAEGFKPVENRDWKPPAQLIGGYLAIHAGKTYDSEAADLITDRLGIIIPNRGEDLPRCAIIAVARLARVIESHEELPREQQIWFSGKYGWVLDDVRKIEPVRVLGKQKLWSLPTPVLAEVRVRWAQTKRAA